MFEKWCAVATMTPGRPVFGGIAQLVERVVRNDEAWGSNPHTSTILRAGTTTLVGYPADLD